MKKRQTCSETRIDILLLLALEAYVDECVVQYIRVGVWIMLQRRIRKN